jgi:hypothetical protein
MRFLAKSEIQNLEVEELAVDPVSPDTGRIWINTTSNKLKYAEQVGMVRILANDIDLQSLQTAIQASFSNVLRSTLLAVPNGIATLDSSGKLLPAQTVTVTTISGNAGSADKLKTARTLALTGDISGSASFDGTANASITATLPNIASPRTATKVIFNAKGLITAGGDILDTDIITALKFTPYNATNPAGYISANQSITISGDATGTGNTAITLNFVNSGVVPGTYKNGTTVDAKGRVTNIVNNSTLAQYGIVDAQPLNSLLTSITALPSAGIVAKTAAGTSAARTITGTVNQIDVSNGDGILANPVLTLSANPVLPGTAGVTLPTGTTAQRPAGVGSTRYNSTTGKAETLTSIGWLDNAGAVISVYKGNVAQVSGTTLIPTDNTVPLSTEGTQVWSQAVTPKINASDMIIEFDSFVDCSKSSNVTVAIFRDTTFIGAAMCNVGGASTPTPFAVKIVDTSTGTTAVTYSARVGMSASGTWYLGRSPSATLGGVNPSGWEIKEVV